jgi:phosphatidylglycerol:prolipoprotein diacylglycerol transferase
VLPYLGKYIHTIKLFGFLPIQPFGVLVGLAIVLGYYLGRRRAAKVGLDPDLCADGQVWIVVGGFAMAHIVSVVFYFPDRVLKSPLELLKFWSGLSSFGGLLGAAITTWWFFTRKGATVIRYVDAIVFGFVPAWVLGRLGCTVVFDHPGLPTDFVLGMADRSGVVRHNLGMYEMFLALFLTLVIYALKNVRPFHGFHPAVMLILYSPFRFLMDTLRIQDKTYFGLTPGQYFSGFTLLVAAVLIYRGLKVHRTPGGEAPPEPAAEAARAARSKGGGKGGGKGSGKGGGKGSRGRGRR